jgi:hypothetical protein
MSRRDGSYHGAFGLLGGEPREVEHHLDRAAVGRIEVHRRVGRVLDAGYQAAEAADVGHAATVTSQMPMTKIAALACTFALCVAALLPRPPWLIAGRHRGPR